MLNRNQKEKNAVFVLYEQTYTFSETATSILPLHSDNIWHSTSSVIGVTAVLIQ